MTSINDDSNIASDPNPIIDTVETFGEQAQSIQPRFMDVWVAPAAIMYLAWAAKGQNRWVRRVAFSAGIYMVYRNWNEYKKIISTIGVQS